VQVILITRLQAILIVEKRCCYIFQTSLIDTGCAFILKKPELGVLDTADDWMFEKFMLII